MTINQGKPCKIKTVRGIAEVKRVRQMQTDFMCLGII